MLQGFWSECQQTPQNVQGFFGLQDPQKAPPIKTSHLNWKVGPLLAWIQAVSMATWDMGHCLSCDKQTIGFKGNHANTQWISYKKEGDGFLADALCDNGYSYTFHLCNMPNLQKYINLKCSPLHVHCLFMFDQHKDKYHVCGVDNLYSSVKFF